MLWYCMFLCSVYVLLRDEECGVLCSMVCVMVSYVLLCGMVCVMVLCGM